MTRDEINAFGDRIKAQLLDGDGALLVDIGAQAPTPDCRVASCTVTICGYVGKVDQDFTGNAIDLEDAIWLARGKLRDARAAHAKKLEEAKAPTNEQGSRNGRD